MHSATYRSLLRTPGAAAFFLSACAGRVGIAMTSLGLVWLVYDKTSSYAVAGVVTGAFAVAEAVCGPHLARLLDRYGQTRALPPMLAAHAASVAALVTLVESGAPVWATALGGVLAGATIPQLGALSAARWSALLPDEASLPVAFSLESLGNSAGYLLGPALVSAVGAGGHPVYGTVLAAALIVGGGLALAAQRNTAPPPVTDAVERHRAGRSLLSPGFGVLVGVNVAIGVFFGAMRISVTAFAVERHAAAAAGPLFVLSSCAGLAAGWLYGLRRWPAAPRTQLAVVATGFAVCAVSLLAASTLIGMAFALVVTEMAVPPTLVLCSVLARGAVRRAVLTQAFVWLNSASAAGTAAATVLAGRMTDRFGAHGGFAVAVVSIAVLAVFAAAGLRAFRARTAGEVAGTGAALAGDAGVPTGQDRTKS
ncbi:MAG TPA: MFS transporter [Actinocatenispora sp.]